MKKKMTVNKVTFYVAMGVLAVFVIVSAWTMQTKSVENKELESKNETLISALQNKVKEIDELNEDISNLEGKIDGLKEIIEKHVGDLDELETEKTQIEADNEIMKKEIKDLRKNLKEEQEANARKAEAKRVALAKEEEQKKKTIAAAKERTKGSVASATTVSRGNASSAGAWSYFEMTAYTAKCNGCSGKTATGIDVRDQSKDHRIVAVDPKVIPLGSIVEIEGYGRFLAGDTGGLIKGYKVDILMQSKQQAYNFGRQKLKIRVVSSGK